MPPKKTYESYDSEESDDGDSGPRGKKQKLDKNSDEYKKRRERNNVAVRKSREASRQKAKDTMEKVSRLRDENKALEQKVTILNKELGVLRDLFLTHASATATVQPSEGSQLPVKAEDNEVLSSAQHNETVLSKDHKYYVSNSTGNS